MGLVLVGGLPRSRRIPARDVQPLADDANRHRAAGLVTEARSLRDRAARIRAYNAIDRVIVSERAYLLPISYGRSMILRRPWVENVWANSMSGVHFDQVEIRR